MPPKKQASREVKDQTKVSVTSQATTSSGAEQTGRASPPKKITKKYQQERRKREKELKERIEILRKEAEATTAELKAIEESQEKKHAKELAEQKERVQSLTETCGKFKTAKERLRHENNKTREAEIWKRYTSVNGEPYPEQPPSMNMHLYAWRKMKSFEYIEFALDKSEECLRTLKLLDELIEHPIFSPQRTVQNWIEVRNEWRQEMLNKIDKACFNMIKNVDQNFERGRQPHVMTFERKTEEMSLSLSVWLEREAPAIVRLHPKIKFSSAEADITLPAAFKKKPFVCRFMHVNSDLFSDKSMTYKVPISLKMEADMLKEVKRCFEVKNEAKASVADREREKVNIVKQKMLEAKAAAASAEKSLNSLRKRDPVKKLIENEEPQVESEAMFGADAKKKGRKQLKIAADGDYPQGSRAQKTAEAGSKFSPMTMLSGDSAKKVLDAISVRSGMRWKTAKVRPEMYSIIDPELLNEFDTVSMISEDESKPVAKVDIRKDSELCFEELDDESLPPRVDELSQRSFESLDYLLGSDEDEFTLQHKSIKTLVRDTIIINRDKPPKVREPHSRGGVSQEIHKKEGSRSQSKRNKSIGSKQEEEITATASEIFDANEDNRQEKYVFSLLFYNLPNANHHINLRANYAVGGCYFVDLIKPVSQPRTLKNGSTVQVFYGELNIQKENYEFNYTPPSNPQSEDDGETRELIDQGLMHLVHITLPLPKKVVFTTPPFIAQWNDEQKYWSKEYVHHFSVKAETSEATFTLGRLWPFAFFINSHCLLPFVTWAMNPRQGGDGVVLEIKCTTINFEFIILENRVSLWRAEGIEASVEPYVEDIIGHFMPLNNLIGEMRSRGLNLFPEEDAFLYFNQGSAKDVVLEDHTNMAMAVASNNLEFVCCEWNPSLKRRKLVFFVREFITAFNIELRYSTVVATSLSAVMYRSTNESTLEEWKSENLGFCPDVQSLLTKAFPKADHYSPFNPVQAVTVYELLQKTKVLSYGGISRPDTPSTSSSSSSRRSDKRKRGKKGMKLRKIATNNTDSVSIGTSIGTRRD